MNGLVRRVRAMVLAVPLMVGAVALSPSVPAESAPPPYTVVTDHLRFPVGVAANALGIYVLERGLRNEVCLVPGSAASVGWQCGGTSGRVSRIDPVTHTRTDLVTGLVHAGGPEQAGGFAPSAIGVYGSNVYVVTGGRTGIGVWDQQATCGGRAECLAFLETVYPQLGRWIKYAPTGARSLSDDVNGRNIWWLSRQRQTVGAGMPAYQPAWSSAPLDTYLNSVAVTKNAIYVADRDAHTVSRAGLPYYSGTYVVAALPTHVTAGVERIGSPTCVAFTPRGLLIIDDAGRFFFRTPGVMTLAPEATTSLYRAKVTRATGCAYDRADHVYIADSKGALLELTVSTMELRRVRPDGTFNLPGGVAVTDPRTVYVVNNSDCPSYLPTRQPNPACVGKTGEVVRVDL